MMREIKFRVWFKLDQKMYTLTSMTFDASTGDVYSVHFPVVYFAPRGNVELMQYTGLKDKNGKEIYEGDIVYDREHILSSDKRYFPVTWGIFKGDLDECETWILGNFWEPGLYTHHEDVEIVGNIYEHPELLSNQGEPS